MAKFSKRETITQNIAYMAIMAAINVVFVLLTTLVPLLMFLMIFVLPLSSTIVALFCKKKYYPIYALVTIGLCMLVTLWDISDVFFFIIPSIITGFVFAFLLEHKINSMWIIIATALLQVGLNYLFIPVVNAIYNRNFILDFATAFGLKDYVYLSYIVPAFLLVINLIQSSFSFIVAKEEVFKFGIKVEEKTIYFLVIVIIQLLLLISIILCGFFLKQLTLFLFIIFGLLGIYILLDIFSKLNKFSIISLISSIFLTIFLFAILYNKIEKPLSFLPIGFFFVFVTIIGIVNNYIFNKKQIKDKIKTEE